MRYKGLLIVLLLLAGALLRAGATDSGGTFAFFSDSATSAGNVFIAGVWDVTATNVTATVDFHPDTLNLKSEGSFVTVYVYIQLPEGFCVGDIDVSTILLNGEVPALPEPTEIGDYDGDGTPDLMVKFDRAAVQDVLAVGEQVEITITGKVAGTPFEGVDIIRVIDPQPEKSGVAGKRTSEDPASGGAHNITDSVSGNWTYDGFETTEGDSATGDVSGNYTAEEPEAGGDGITTGDVARNWIADEPGAGGDDSTIDNGDGDPTPEEPERSETNSTTTDNADGDCTAEEPEASDDDSTTGDADDDCTADESEAGDDSTIGDADGDCTSDESEAGDDDS